MSSLHLSRRGYYPGLVAGLLASATMILAGNVWNAPVPPQLIADRLISLIPLDVFSRLLGQFESSAKPLTFVLLIAAQVLLGGLVGALLAPHVRRGTSLQNVFWATFIAVSAVLALVIAPVGGIGLFGAESERGAWIAMPAFLVEALVFAATLTTLLAGSVERSSPTFSEDRRRALRALALGFPAVIATVYLGRFLFSLSSRSDVSGAARDDDGLSLALTPTEDFYVVSKNFVDPNVAPDDWSLKIEGQVENPRSIGFDELRSLPSFSQIATLQCISNEVGGHYISNGQWTGIRLKDLLEQAGIGNRVVDVVLHAADDYADSIPLLAALDPRTMLAYDLNGQPLNRDHGFPLRLIVPGIYGMKNVKWITKIELVEHDFRGYWQKQGWSDVATIMTMSRIDVPKSLSEALAGQPLLLGGIAFAGDRGISKVQISSDDGVNWHDAALRKPLSELSWVLWTYEWTPSTPGNVSIAVRATDGAGEIQTEQRRSPLPDGATGYHKIAVRVTNPTA